MCLLTQYSLSHASYTSINLYSLPIHRWPRLRGGRVSEVAVSPRWPCLRGGRVSEVVASPRWPGLRDGRVSEVAVSPRWPRLRGGRVSEMAASPRWPRLGDGRVSAGLEPMSARRSSLAARFLAKARALPETDPLRASAEASPPACLKDTQGWRMLLLLLLLLSSSRVGLRPTVAQRLSVRQVAAGQGRHGPAVPQLRRSWVYGPEDTESRARQAGAPQHNVLRRVMAGGRWAARPGGRRGS